MKVKSFASDFCRGIQHDVSETGTRTVVSLGHFLRQATTDELAGFKEDLKQLVELFQPSLEKYAEQIKLHLQGPQGVSWDEKSLGYQTVVISINGPRNLNDLLYTIIHAYFDEAPSHITRIYEARPWYNKDFPLMHISMPIIAVIERILHGEPIEHALDAEMDEIAAMRDPWQERVAQCFVQNLVIEGSSPLDFPDHKIEIKEKEIGVSYQEDGKPPESMVMVKTVPLKVPIFSRTMLLPFMMRVVITHSLVTCLITIP